MSADFAEVAGFFKILSNPLRLQMLYATASAEKYVGQLARMFDVSEYCASQHLALLRGAGLIDGVKNGQRVYYKLTAAGAERLHRAWHLVEDMAEEAGAAYAPLLSATNNATHEAGNKRSFNSACAHTPPEA